MKKRPKLRELVRLEETSGSELAEQWRRTSNNHQRLSEATRDWFSICEERIPEGLAVDYLRVRKLLATIFIKKPHRGVIADFCTRLSDELAKTRA